MAYFPNGSSGDHYMEKWCNRCKNWRDLNDGRGPGCPIWDIHLMFNYNRVKNEGVANVLDALIPMGKKKLYPIQCSMFWQREGEIEGQSHIDFKETK